MHIDVVGELVLAHTRALSLGAYGPSYLNRNRMFRHDRTLAIRLF